MTTEPKFTPGPWYYKAGINQMCSDDSTICEVITEKPVAEISTGPGKKHYIFSPTDVVDSPQANARLISKAPEMYELLESLVVPYNSAMTGDSGLGRTICALAWKERYLNICVNISREAKKLLQQIDGKEE